MPKISQIPTLTSVSSADLYLIARNDFSFSVSQQVLENSISAVSTTPKLETRFPIKSNSSDLEHDLDISGGTLFNSLGSKIVGGNLTKQFDVSFAKGTNSGGDDGSGLPVNSDYFIHVISENSSGDVDYLGSQSKTSPTIPMGWTLQGYLGAFRTDASSNFIQVLSSNNMGLFRMTKVLENDIFDTGIVSATPSGASVLGTIPDNVVCEPLLSGRIYVENPTGNASPNVVLRDILNGDQYDEVEEFVSSGGTGVELKYLNTPVVENGEIYLDFTGTWDNSQFILKHHGWKELL